MKNKEFLQEFANLVNSGNIQLRIDYTKFEGEVCGAEVELIVKDGSKILAKSIIHEF